MVLATPNSRKVVGQSGKPLGITLALVVLALAFSPGLRAQTNVAVIGVAAAPGGLAVVSPNSYRPGQRPSSQVEAEWALGRACFDRADSPTNDNTMRAEVAQQGIAACRQAVAQDPNSAAAHYYLGLNLGELARTETLGALKLVRQMEREFIDARSLDERFDYAGPDRCLGLLYRDAPSFGSIGNRSKARQHLERALQLAPDDPENRLNLVETELMWGERDRARRDLTALENDLPTARTKFSGPDWTGSWADWETRLEAAKKKLEQPSRKLETPRH